MTLSQHIVAFGEKKNKLMLFVKSLSFTFMESYIYKVYSQHCFVSHFFLSFFSISNTTFYDSFLQKLWGGGGFFW